MSRTFLYGEGSISNVQKLAFVSKTTDHYQSILFDEAGCLLSTTFSSSSPKV